MSDFATQLLTVFPAVLFFISLCARSIPHYAERRKQGFREAIRNLDSTFVFNLLIDCFTLSVINALILMFQFGVLGCGFLLLFAGLTLCVFGFSFLRAGSLMGAAFALFILGSLFATEAIYFWFFGQTVVIGVLMLSDWQVASVIPIVIILVFIVAMIASIRKSAKNRASTAS
jgi:hypothetical protein